MAKIEEKQKATALRKRGESIKSIAKQLDVSKGSVSLWCQDISLTPNQKQKLKEKQISAGLVGRQAGADSNRKKRLQAISKHANEGLKAVGELSDRDLLMLGIGLYWGEGVKSRSGQAALVNSDPDVILLGKLWFKKCFNVPDASFRPYVYISEVHSSRSRKIVQFWSRKLNLSKTQFKIIVLKNRPKKKYENHDSYFGVLSLRIVKGTDLKYRIQGLINACKY